MRKLTARLQGLSAALLRRMDLDETCAELLATELETNTSLTRLDLARNELECEGAIVLAMALETNSVLEKLCLSQNGIRARGANALFQALSVNSALLELDLDRNCVGEAAGSDAVSLALRENTTLVTLTLSFNGIGFEFCQALALGLQSNSTVQCLNLFGNPLDFEALQELCNALEGENSTLRELDIGGNVLGVDSLHLVSTRIFSQVRLKKLGLAQCGIGMEEEGVDLVALGLRETRTLTKIDLSQNMLGERGGATMLQAISQNACLVTVHLDWNDIPDHLTQARIEVTNTFWVTE